MLDSFLHFNEVYLPDVSIPACPAGLYETCPLINLDGPLVEESDGKLDSGFSRPIV